MPKNVKPISFSIPKKKITKQLTVKAKTFATHIVDIEVANKLYGDTLQEPFETESDYYNDLQHSKFGITTKRAGWDCLRHYEIAANGSIICFKDLDKKPEVCAPHGLINGKNCIGYTNYSDLMHKISQLSESDYKSLQLASLDWIQKSSTIERVKTLIHNYYK
ncbi:MAG: hypothetical protein JO072_00905 [Parafilimonas sp.]|nr:hypothetical protein [Parafilimonas sp.]